VTEPDAALASLVDGELVEVDAVEAPDEAPDDVPAVLEVDIEVPPLVEIEGSTSAVEVGGAASPEHPAASAAIAEQMTRPQGAQPNRSEPRIPWRVLQPRSFLRTGASGSPVQSVREGDLG